MERIFMMKNKEKNTYHSKVLEKQNVNPNRKGCPLKRTVFHRKIGKKS